MAGIDDASAQEGSIEGTFVHEVWSSPAWQAEAESWIRGVLTREHIAVIGPVRQPRVRPWSTQLTVATDRGTMWFKENTAAMHYEAALLELLGRIAPDRVIAPVAVDRDRGWMLTPDGGVTVATLTHTDEQMWIRIVREYAELQRMVAEHQTEVLGTGVPRLSPLDAPQWAAHHAWELAGLSGNDPRRITSAQARRIVDCTALLRGDAEALAAGPVPLSLDHNDLHHNNAFVPAGPGGLRFFDFGDALWAHPFSSMLVTANVIATQWAVDGSDPRLHRIAEAYLDVWSDLAPRRALRRLLAAAMRLGRINRAHSWRLVLSTVPRAYWGELATSGADWLLKATEFPPADQPAWP